MRGHPRGAHVGVLFLECRNPAAMTVPPREGGGRAPSGEMGNNKTGLVLCKSHPDALHRPPPPTMCERLMCLCLGISRARGAADMHSKPKSRCFTPLKRKWQAAQLQQPQQDLPLRGPASWFPPALTADKRGPLGAMCTLPDHVLHPRPLPPGASKHEPQVAASSWGSSTRSEHIFSHISDNNMLVIITWL